MVESYYMTRAEQDAIAGAPIIAGLSGPRRSGRGIRSLGQKTSFIEPYRGWTAGHTKRPPVDEFSTQGGSGQDEKNDYYTRLYFYYKTSDALAWVPVVGSFHYCTQSLCVFKVTEDTTYINGDADSRRQTWTVMPLVRYQNAVAFAPGNPVVGASITVSSNALRQAGVYTATGMVVESSATEVTIGLTNGATLANGDVVTDGTNSRTVDTSVDTVNAPYCTFPGQKLTWTGAESGTFGLGDRVQNQAGVQGTLIYYSNPSNFIIVLPDLGTQFAIGDVITNLSSGATTQALTAAVWDTVTNGVGTLVLSTAVHADEYHGIVEKTNGSLAVPNDPAKPTVRASELGMHWPLQSVGAMQLDRREAIANCTVSGGAFAYLDQVEVSDGETTLTCTVLDNPVSLPGNLTLGPATGANKIGGQPDLTLVGPFTLNNLTQVGTGNFTSWTWYSVATGASGHWPAGREDTGISEWRRFIPMRAGMMGRRGGGIRIEGYGLIKSVPGASQTNYLDLIFIPYWKYPTRITAAARDSGERGGLRAMPSNRFVGWRIPIPATTGAGGVFWFEVIARPFHPQTQLWTGRFYCSDEVIGESVDLGVEVPLVDKQLIPIYRSFTGATANDSPHTPEYQDYNIGFCFRCEGTYFDGGTERPGQPFGSVGASTIPQDGTRIYCQILGCKAEYLEAE